MEQVFDRKKSNYEKTRDKMRLQFLLYDQAAMIEKFSLDSDEDYLFLRLLGRRYRIGRKDGIAEWSEDGFRSSVEADYDESMILYDILCCSQSDCCLSGRFVMTNSLKGIVYTGGSGVGDSIYQKDAVYFDGNINVLQSACVKMGGIAEGKGDVAYRFQVFEFFPVLFQFWESDEDFPPQIQWLWDENALQFMHYETLWSVMSHLLKRLRELMLS